MGYDGTAVLRGLLVTRIDSMVPFGANGDDHALFGN